MSRESEEVAGHAWRKAQERRLSRFCREQGVDIADLMAGLVVLDLDPICGSDGKIAPEPQDFPL